MAIDNNSSDQNNQDSSDLIPEVESSPVKPTNTADVRQVRARRAKPMVEGINAPAAGSPIANSGPFAGNETFGPVSDPSPTLESASSSSTVIPPKITLTSSEKQLIEDPIIQPTASAASSSKPKAFAQQTVQKIILPSSKKTGRKLIWSLLISLLAVCLVFGALLWYNNQTGGSLSDNFNLFPKRPSVPAPVYNEPLPTSVNTEPSVSAPSTTPSSTPAATLPPVASSTPPVAAPVLQVKVTNTPTGYLNVRNAPTTSGTLVTQVHPGEVYQYSKTQSGWYYITLANGSQGWVIGQYVQVLK